MIYYILKYVNIDVQNISDHKSVLTYSSGAFETGLMLLLLFNSRHETHTILIGLIFVGL